MPRAWLIIVLLAVACTGDPSPSPPAEEDAARGGTLRVGLWVPPDADASWQEALFDPQRTFYHPALRCCLLRTLVGYRGRPIEDGGTELEPDLAEELPEVSPDGLTWTFRLRAGLRYAPPFDERPILAQDFITALERTVRVDEAPHYDVVEGVSAFREGDAGTISGVHAPDERTLVFRLVEPAGDFGNRVAMPYLAPIPVEALAQHDDHYGSYLVASGPYMVEGSGTIDHADPDAEPVIPRDSLGRFVLVRNPSWSVSLDPLRPAFLDRIEFVPVRDLEDAPAAAARGEIDVMIERLLSTTRSEAIADPETRARLRDAPLPGLFFIPLNVAQPPFDDVAVRRAAGVAVDRGALIAQLAPIRGSAFLPVTHAFPDVTVGGLLRGYTPLADRDGASDPRQAREHMAGSRHDADGDGRCDGDACTVFGNAFGNTSDETLELIAADLAEIGIEIEWVELESRSSFDPAAHVGLMAIVGWGAEYPSANDFVNLLTDPGEGSLNVSLVGATPEQLRSWGYAAERVPSLDDKIAGCRARSGSAAFGCWAELDQLLSEQVVAWIPIATPIGTWVVSDRVDRFEVASADALPAIERISVREAAEP